MAIPAPSAGSGPRRLLRLSDVAADHVRESIVSGRLGAGEYIRPETVAGELGISATPAREGLLALQTEGLLTVEPRKGFTVRALSSDDIRDIYDAQALLGGELTARAATVIDHEALTRLETLQDDLEQAAARPDHDAVEHLNHQFHEAIYRLADSRKLRWLLARTLAYSPRGFFAVLEGWSEASAADHRAIIDRLRAGDPPGAREAMASHIRNAGLLLAAQLAAQSP